MTEENALLMEYNTSRNHMQIAEYGRNIQKMIAYTKTIADKEERNRAARAIIKVMGQVNPTLKNTEDLTHKLWDHMFMIADFDFDVDSPYPLPKREQFLQGPERIPYSETEIKERHYGRIIGKMINQLAEEQDEEKRMIYAFAAANAMKAAYLKWNRDTVEDVIIIKDLKRLSGGKVNLPLETVLSRPQDLVDHTMQAVGSKNQRNKRNKRNNGKKRRDQRG
jgi:hypothetical protein